MWDIKIGTSSKRICSANNIWSFEDDFKYSISANSVSYWVSESFLGVGMTIFENSEEYSILHEMLRLDGRDDKGISEWIKATVIKHVSVNVIVAAMRSRYNDGYNAATREFQRSARKLFGLD